MKRSLISRLLTLGLCFSMILKPALTMAEDIDIFLGTSAGTAGNPNILIVLDNTSNWSRNDQKWTDATQGQAEVDAIKTTIQSLDSDVNIGLMEFVTGGNANDDGGYIRSAVEPMTATYKTSFSNQLNTIYNNITSPNEKTNSGMPYGDLMYDAYNYFGGRASHSPNAVIASLADSNGYTTNYTNFKSPLSSATTCAKSYIIFIGNPPSRGPTSDTAANTGYLSDQGGNTSQLALSNISSTTSTTSTVLGNTSQCYSSQPSSCGSIGFADQCSKYSEGCSCGNAVASTGPVSCATGTQAYSIMKSTPTTTTTQATGSTTVSQAWTNSCYKNSNAASTAISGGTDHGNLTCPASTTSGNSTTSYTCSYSSTGSTTQSAACPHNSNLYQVQQTAIATVTTTTTTTTTTNLGYTSQCYSSASSCSTSDYSGQCSGTGVTCSCSTPTSSTTASCSAGTSLYQVLGVNSTTALSPTGTATTDTAPYNADEWARFMATKGVPIGNSSDRQLVSTYTIDVYNQKPDATQTALLWSMAKNGHGKYFAAKNEQAIIDALKQIMIEIKAVNSTFASASLPVNATNRTQSENQVFIPVFRPDPDALPRWFGNLKRYKIINTSGTTELGDANGSPAINLNTGFISDCATSYWTTDAGAYWSDKGVSPDPASACTGLSSNALLSVYSDAPDGSFVEKGAVGEVIRQGNNPTGTQTTTWDAGNRTVLTATSSTTSGSSLPAFSTTTSGLSSNIVDFMLGKDIDTTGATVSTQTRATIHGDVVHSRPLPINYGGSTGVVVYYGSNDGTLRAVEANTGKEKWAFIAPEFDSRLSRLMTNSPLVSYPSVANAGVTPTPTSKDYFFDGSTAVYQNADNSKIWIYPTMRRGGRMIYALDVTTPSTPKFKWKAGCSDLVGDTNCTSDAMKPIGQTWSTPNVAFIKGYSTTSPVLVVGGGYDSCEDADTKTPSCTGEKGAVIYILDGDTGAVIKSFATDRSVASDISMVDIDGDGYPDYAYAADTGGSIYRISFINGPTTKVALTSADWTMDKVAYTSGSGRKFLFSPAVFATKGYVYLALGSGDREHPLSTDYPYNDVVNRFYVYKDDLSSTALTNLDFLANYTSNTSCDTAAVTTSSTLKGWFMDLNQYGQGEQTVNSALIASGMVTFSTNRPVTDSNSCSTELGEARGYWVNLLNASGAIGVSGICGGDRSSTFIGGGMPPSPVMATGVPITYGSTTKMETIVIGAVQKNNGASAPISPQQMRPSLQGRRKRVFHYTSGE